MIYVVFPRTLGVYDVVACRSEFCMYRMFSTSNDAMSDETHPLISKVYACKVRWREAGVRRLLFFPRVGFPCSFVSQILRKGE